MRAVLTRIPAEKEFINLETDCMKTSLRFPFLFITVFLYFMNISSPSDAEDWQFFMKVPVTSVNGEMRTVYRFEKLAYHINQNMPLYDFPYLKCDNDELKKLELVLSFEKNKIPDMNLTLVSKKVNQQLFWYPKNSPQNLLDLDFTGLITFKIISNDKTVFTQSIMFMEGD
jgi:hypothetical protein